jgi:predicted dehydrogenase
MTNGQNGSKNGNGKPLTFALIGSGRISQVHFQVMAKEPRVKLLAVADIDESAAKSAAEAYGAKAYTDYAKLLDEVRPEAVVLCTPPDTHREITEASVAAGAHVLCEKPLAISVEDALAMASSAEDAGKVLMMASKFRYVADVVKAKGIIESGILGEIIAVENEFCSRVDMKRRWNSKKSVAGGGVLIDNGSHSADIVRYLVGPVDQLLAIFGKQWQEIEVEDTCKLFVRTVDGTLASIDLSWSIHKESPYYVRVYGTDGTLEIGWKGSRYRQSEKLDWVAFGSGYDKLQAVGAQLANFIDTIRGNGQPLISIDDAVESVRVIQKAYATQEEARWERVSS